MAQTIHPSPIGTMPFGNLITPEPDLSDRMVWQASLRIPNEDVVPLLEAIEAAITEKRKTDPTFPADHKKLAMPYKAAEDRDPDNPDGPRIQSESETLFKFVRKLEYKDKQGNTHQRSAPTIYDAAGTVVNKTVKEIGWGSVGRVYYKPIPYDFKGKKGISLALEGFQIKELKTQDSDIVAAPIEGGWVAPPSDEVDMADFAEALAD